MTLLYVFLSSYGLELEEKFTKVHRLFIFPYFFFTECFFAALGSHPGYRITFIHHDHLGYTLL